MEITIAWLVQRFLVSRDSLMRFVYLFLFSLDRYEVRNWAGSGLFFILKTFHIYIFKTVVNRGTDPLE
jgi:hypothetical protein